MVKYAFQSTQLLQSLKNLEKIVLEIYIKTHNFIGNQEWDNLFHRNDLILRAFVAQHE